MSSEVTIDTLKLEIESNSNTASKGLDALSKSLGKLKNSTKNTGIGNVSKSFTDLAAKIGIAYMSVKKIGSSIGSSIKEINSYIENVNLFNVSLGQFAVEAKKYAETVGEIMGIDSGEWMRNQGVFMTLATGFGTASDRAYTMSKNLTQLGYDLSSFYNIDTNDAMLKLQSGLSGELEPLRRLGYDLSQAKLQAVALELGITKAVSAMTQAEKAELRYYAIMTQVTQVQGDMSRTLDQPANQLRILKAQFIQLTRAIGSVFIPILNKVVPYLIAATQVLRELVGAVASFLGFTMPEVDYSGITDGANDASDALNEATESAKKLKDYTMGFDELNVLNPDTGADDDSLSGLGFGFELPEYDFIGSATGEKIKEIVEDMKKWLGITGEITSWGDLFDTKLGAILEAVGAIGLGIAAWKIASGVTSAFSALKVLAETGTLKNGLGITLMITGIALEGQGAYDLGQGDVTLDNIIKTAIGSALGIAGSLIVFGTGPLGWTVGIGLAITAFITGFTIGMRDQALEDDLANRFGDLVLSDGDIQEIISKLTTSELSLELKLFVSQETAVIELKKSVDDVLTKLRLYNFKISMGLEVSQEQYQTAADELISSIEKYIEEKQITATMAVSILLGDSATGDRLTDFTNEFYLTTQGALTDLGSKLKETISKGFVNGEWIPNKLQEAIELQKEIQQLYDYLSTVEFNAKLAAIKLDASETDLSVSDFEKIMAEAQSVIEEQIGNLEGVRLEGLKVAKMEFDQNILKGMTEAEATAIYNTTVREIEDKFLEGKISLTAGTYDFGMDIIMDRYSEEIEKTIPLFEQTTRELFIQGVGVVLPEETYNNVSDLYLQLRDAFVFGLDDLDISKEARANLKRLTSQLKPTEEEYQEIVDEAFKTGQAVPENISKGLNDMMMLKAISGDMTAINHLIGQHLSTDPEFLNLLATAEGAGMKLGNQVGRGLLSNLTVIEDASNGTITLMNDTIGKKVLEVTPELVQNLKDMGYNLSEGLLIGAEEKLVADKKSWVDWAWLPWNWFRDTNEIHSPSKLFERGGSFIATGLFGGVNNGVVKSDYDTIFGRLTDSLSGVKTEFKKIINGILAFIEGMVNGVIEGVNVVIRALNSFKIDVPGWVTNLTGIKDFGFNLQTLSTVSIPRLADGGFVDEGQLFVAREAGAEMVGSIGRRTAVANNDQIVSGIAHGVAEANGEQNTLLREQNALLRQMLEKENGVYLDGRKITTAVEKHQRERGRVVITGGVY